MLLVKLLLLVAGSGTVAGVTYSQVKKSPTEKTMVVSNNQESKIRAKLEKKMDKELLQTKKGFVEERQKTAVSQLKTDANALDLAKTELTKAYADLNSSKDELNKISDSLKQNYETLINKETTLKNALVAKMSHELNEKEKELKKEFYEAQKTTYEKEKKSIQEKINAIEPTNSCATSSNVCTCKDSFSLNSTNPKTNEETTIETQIKNELNSVCQNLTVVESNITNNQPSTDTTKTTNYTNADKARDAEISQIESNTQKYNQQIIDIKSKESEVLLKLLKFQHQEKTYLASKLNNEKIKNEIEILSEEIQNIQ